MAKPPLPIRQPLAPAYRLSLATALLAACLSLAGLLWQSAFYPGEAVRQSFVSNDVVNLLVGLPVLLATMRLAQRGRLTGLLVWPGALFYFTYNAIAYTVALLPALLSFAHLSVVILSLLAVAALLRSIDAPQTAGRLRGKVHERLAGGFLAVFGLLFFLRSAGQLYGLASGETILNQAGLGVLVADLLVTPAWLVCGVLLWRRRDPGYAAGAGLLFQAGMLFVGLLVFFILQPFLAGTRFPLADFSVILIMGLFCAVPLALFLAGVHRQEGESDTGQA